MPVYAPSPAQQTVDYLIDRTFDLLMGAAREERNLLTNDIDATQTEFTITYPPASLQRGTYLAIDDEEMFVWDSKSSSQGASTVTVQRGDRGTTAASHAANTIIQVNPYFTRYQVRESLRDEIRSWEPQIFQVQTATISAVNYVRGYDLGNLGSWFFIIDVQESPDPIEVVTTDNLWRSVPYRVDQSADTSSFPSGNALFITSPLGVFDTPRTLHVTYAKALDVDTTFNGSDTLGAMGLETPEVDIPSYGAAWRLASSREVRRMLFEGQGQVADLQNFPPGYQLKAAEGFKALRDARLQDAIERLRAKYPLRRAS